MGSPATQDVFHGMISFVTGILKDLVRGIAFERNTYFPGLGIVLGIVDRGLILDRISVHARKTFNDVQVLAFRNPFDAACGGAGRDPTLSVVIRRIDNQRVAFPS